MLRFLEKMCDIKKFSFVFKNPEKMSKKKQSTAVFVVVVVFA